MKKLLDEEIRDITKRMVNSLCACPVIHEFDDCILIAAGHRHEKPTMVAFQFDDDMAKFNRSDDRLALYHTMFYQIVCTIESQLGKMRTLQLLEDMKDIISKDVKGI